MDPLSMISLVFVTLYLLSSTGRPPKEKKYKLVPNTTIVEECK